jgi:hypothetical protein
MAFDEEQGGPKDVGEPPPDEPGLFTTDEMVGIIGDDLYNVARDPGSGFDPGDGAQMKADAERPIEKGQEYDAAHQGDRS